jgi:uncharacterized protein YndB with AHSA1/START domain
MNVPTDRIERQILLKAPRSRVWRALCDAHEFGRWFGVSLEKQTFAPGMRVEGPITNPGYQHLILKICIDRVEPERLLSWSWHPAAVDDSVDYSAESNTQVEFQLEEVPGGTLLTLVESGFDQIPVSRRLAAFRMNSNGWDHQMKNIEQHVATQ